jgi:hypothetical protein
MLRDAAARLLSMRGWGRRASSLLRLLGANSRERKDTGRRVTDPNFLSAGHPAPMCGDFGRLASRTSRTGWFPTSIRSQPVEAGGPVVVPDGRVTRRLHLFHASRFRRVRVPARRRLQAPPETRVGLVPRRRRRSPPASPGTDRTMPYMGGTAVDLGLLSKDVKDYFHTIAQSNFRQLTSCSSSYLLREI